MLKFIRLGLPKVLTSNHVSSENVIIPNLLKRHAHYESSKPIPKPEDLPKYEVTKNENDWKYVERLLPETTVPPIEPKKYYPSGWVPPRLNPNMPYILQRSRNEMLPVYLLKRRNGQKRITKIIHVHGDMWRLADDLKKFLEGLKQKEVCIKVHEVCSTLMIHGDHVSDVKTWALRKGF